MGENDSINIEKGGESCQWTCRKGSKKWREKKGREEKRTPCFNPAWFPLALSLYGSAACVYVSVCVFVFVIRAQSQCCSERERLDQQTHADYNPSEGFFPNHSPKVLTPSPTLLHWILDWRKKKTFTLKFNSTQRSNALFEKVKQGKSQQNEFRFRLVEQHRRSFIWSK